MSHAVGGIWTTAPVTAMASMVWEATWPRLSPVIRQPLSRERAMASVMRTMKRRVKMVKYSGEQVSRSTSCTWVKGTTKKSTSPA